MQTNKPSDHSKNTLEIVALAAMLLIMSFAFPAMWIEFYHPEYEPSLVFVMEIVMEGFLVVGFAVTVLCSLTLFFIAWRHISKDKQNKLSLLFIAGSLLNMVAAGIFAFSISNIKEVFNINLIIVSIIFLIVGSVLLLRYEKEK